MQSGGYKLALSPGSPLPARVIIASDYSYGSSKAITHNNSRARGGESLGTRLQYCMLENNFGWPGEFM